MILDQKSLVSVLMTVYNRAAYISEAIESVVNSTYQNWELIITDDCSSDNSLEIALRYQEKDNRIKVFVNDTNLGDYNNRNKAASYAKGTYLKYLDADDLLYPHALEIMVSAMDKFPETALGISQEVFEDYDAYPFLLSSHDVYVREFLKRGVLGVGPTGTIIRADAFKEVGRFSGARHIGDTELWLKLAAYGPVLKIQSGLVFWRRHEGQEIVREWKHPEIIAIRYNHSLKVLTEKGCPLTKAENEQAKYVLKRKHARLIIGLALKRMKFRNSYIIFKKSDFSLFDLLKVL
jgi:glycosyltransferase involved in cell wall biosynthesis